MMIMQGDDHDCCDDGEEKQERQQEVLNPEAIVPAPKVIGRSISNNHNTYRRIKGQRSHFVRKAASGSRASLKPAFPSRDMGSSPASAADAMLKLASVSGRGVGKPTILRRVRPTAEERGRRRSGRRQRGG